jgi:hypothetical protein
MDVLSKELRIQLSFVKTSEFGGRGVEPRQTPLSMPLTSGILTHPIMNLYLFEHHKSCIKEHLG